MRPDEIVRVEYHDNPGLRYGNAEIVIDYIVRRPETGGSFGIDIMQSPHVGWGNYQASMKINHKKSEFSANFWGGPRNFYGVYRDNLEDFNLENGTELHRYEKGVPSHWKMMQQWLNVAYNLQDNNKYQLNISVNYSGNNSPIQRYHGQLINRTDETDYVDMTDETNSNRHTPSIDIYYQRNLKKNQVLIFDVVGTCNKEFSDRTYQESRDNVLLTDVPACAGEPAYVIPIHSRTTTTSTDTITIPKCNRARLTFTASSEEKRKSWTIWWVSAEHVRSTGRKAV